MLQIASSLKRIAQADGLAEPKYTPQQAVEAKIGSVQGWQDFLSYTGFHFIGAMKDVPSTIVFPEHDDSGLQRKALRHLEALLGLPQACLLALCTLSKRQDVASPLLSAVSVWWCSMGGYCVVGLMCLVLINVCIPPAAECQGFSGEP